MMGGPTGLEEEDWTVPPPPPPARLDDIEKFLLEIQNFTRNPWSFVVRFFNFIGGALALTGQFYKPSLASVLPRTLGVIIVVAAFCVVVSGVDGLFAALPQFYRSAG